MNQALQLRTDDAVIVLNPGYAGLGIARDLGPLGIDVYGMTAEQALPGNRSRWLKYLATPDSFASPDLLCEYLLDFARGRPDRPVLFPTRDHDVAFLTRCRERLQEAFRVPPATPETLDLIMNKSQMSRVSRDVGIDVPEEILLTGDADLRELERLRHPVICKPLYARHWRSPEVWRVVGKRKAVRSQTLTETLQFYARVKEHEPRMLVQEWVPGGERNLLIFGSYCATPGRPSVYFTARKRLQSPALSGDGTIVEALPLPEVAAAAHRLLDAVQYRGISEVEFKLHEESGRLFLIEINPRHWDQHRLGTAVGVNLSEAAYRDLTGQPQRPMSQRQKGALWIADQTFARYVVRALKRKVPYQGVLQAAGAARTWGVFDATDLKPFFAMLNQLRRH